MAENVIFVYYNNEGVVRGTCRILDVNRGAPYYDTRLDVRWRFIGNVVRRGRA